MMQPGLRSHKSATLRVAEPVGLPPDMRGDVREILSVQAGNPRKGHATALMRRTCREADKDFMVLLVNVHAFDDGPSNGPSNAQLQKWYSRFGFETVQSEPLLMTRNPAR